MMDDNFGLKDDNFDMDNKRNGDKFEYPIWDKELAFRDDEFVGIVVIDGHHQLLPYAELAPPPLHLWDVPGSR